MISKRNRTAALLGTLLVAVPAASPSWAQSPTIPVVSQVAQPLTSTTAQAPAVETTLTSEVVLSSGVIVSEAAPLVTGMGLAMVQAPAPVPSGQSGARAPMPTPTAADRLGGESIFGEAERLPKVSGGNLNLPPIMAATTDIEKIGNGSAPTPFRTQSDTPMTDLPESGYERSLNWSPLTYHFAAANTFSHPRYFEDRMLERHGHERFPYLQPMISGARFFATFPMLPYLMTVTPADECEYQLGYFRPGTAVHPYLQRPPYQRNAAVVQGAAVAGGVIAFP